MYKRDDLRGLLTMGFFRKEPTMVEKGNRRGLSTIVATLLIILLVLVAVGILWVVVRNVIQNGAEQISLGKFTLDLKISQVQQIPGNDSALNVKIKRNTGDGEFVGINFVAEDDEGTEVIKKNVSMQELETRNFQLIFSTINVSRIKKISIFPIFLLKSGKEVIGDVKDEYVFSSGAISQVSLCVPNCEGKNCGSDGCGGTCGVCSGSTPNCVNGVCTAQQCTPSCAGRVCGSDGCNGTCGTCSLANSAAQCNASYQCEIAYCNSGYSNCDSNVTNGCETILGTTSNCASCINTCLAGQTCTNYACSNCVVTSYNPALNTFCGSKNVSTNCGSGIYTGTLTCISPNTCGGLGIPNTCGCTVSSYNPALNTFCGSKNVSTNCGSGIYTGTLTCTSPNFCNSSNVCSCTAETNTAFCSRLGKTCGSVTANDNCGNSRTVSSCGTCGTGYTCNSTNQCVASTPTCGDGIQNQGETGIDCGGPCSECTTYLRTFYVSNSGNDNNNGTTPSSSWRTLSKVNSQSFSPGDGILFKRGDIWHETLTVSSSGSSSSPITYGAYGTGTNPIISGFTTITGWTNQGNGIYSKTVSTESMPNMVTVDGVNTPLGRTPNLPSINGWPSNIPTGDSYTSTSMTDSNLASSPNLNGADIVMRSSQSTNERRTITHSGHTVTYSSTHDTPPSGAGYFIQNHISTLDVLGEWSYANGVINMYFGSDNPNNHIIKVSTIDNLIDVNNKNYITLDGLIVEGANDIGINIGSHTIVQNCIVHFGGKYGFYGNACTYSTITLNTIDNNNNDGIYLENTCSHYTITYNNITNSGMILGMGGGGWSDNEAIACEGDYGLISHNNLNNQGYDGIRWGGQSTEVSYNFITNSCQNAGDGAGIYSYRDATSGRVVKYNIVLNSAAQPYGWNYEDAEASNGIYLDGDSNTLIINNVLANNQGSGLFINSNQNTMAEYNTFFNNVYGIKIRSEENTGGVDGTARDHTVLYNTLVAKTNDQLCLDANTDLTNSDLSLFGTIDYNYYARPIDIDNYIEWVYHSPSLSWDDVNLAQWKALYGYDSHSTISSKSITDVNNIRFEYNPTTSNEVISLGSNSYVDARGTAYSGSITLAPYTAIVLIKN